LTTRTAEDDARKTSTLRHPLTLVAFTQAPHQSGEPINRCVLDCRKELEIARLVAVPSWNVERPQANVYIAILLVLEWKNLITKAFVFQVRKFC